MPEVTSNPEAPRPPAGPAALLSWHLRDDIMSALHMFLPACEPARSEMLAQLVKTHHVPRHLVKGIVPRSHGARIETTSADAPQGQQQAQQASPQDSEAPAAEE